MSRQGEGRFAVWVHGRVPNLLLEGKRGIREGFPKEVFQRWEWRTIRVNHMMVRTRVFHKEVSTCAKIQSGWVCGLLQQPKEGQGNYKLDF